MTYSFIVNPVAGKGSGRRVLRWLESARRSLPGESEVFLTEHEGHATDLARLCNGSVVVAVGGDGTVNEVANGIVQTRKKLAVLPSGSGNDLIKSLAIPKDTHKALDILIRGTTRRIDLGVVSCSSDAVNLPRIGGVSGRYFVNGVGIGLDAAVAERTRHLRFISGLPLYFVALLQALARYTSPTFEIRTDSVSETSRKLLIAVGNGRCAGGGFYLTPDAVPDDGLLDVCMVDHMPVPRILPLIPKVLQAKHRSVKGVTMFTATEVSVTSRSRFHVHADGELVGLNVSQVQVGIRPKSIDFITGS